MKKSVVFTASEFQARFNMFYELMTGEPNPYPVEISTRMTRGLGKCCYVKRTSYSQPIKTRLFRFVDTMLIGAFTLDFVDDIIRHEICHHIAHVRHGECCGHDARFHAICKEFNCNGFGTSVVEKSDNYHEVMDAHFKYVAVCPNCGYKWYTNSSTEICKVGAKRYSHRCKVGKPTTYERLR